MDSHLFLFKQKSILYIEDDKITRERTASILNLMFKNIFVASNAEEGLSIFDREQIDLVLADIGLPDKDGLSLVKMMRTENYHLPIVMLTSMSALEQVLQAANLAVDGYIVKPFDLSYLINMLAKAFKRNDTKHQIANLGNEAMFNMATQEVSANGVIVPLGKKERDLLAILVSAYPNTVSSDEIASKLWPLESVGDSALKNIVMRIRKKLGDELIQSVKSVGYRVELAP